MQQLRFSSFTS